MANLVWKAFFSRTCTKTTKFLAVKSNKPFSVPDRSMFAWQSVNHKQPTTIIQPVRFKGQNRVRKGSATVTSLREEVRLAINEDEMMQEYTRLVDRFQDDLYRKLSLMLTPEMFYTIPIPNERVQLGEVAAIVSGTSAPSSNFQPTSQILIDLSGRPDLVPAAKAAVSQFLSKESGTSNSKRGKSSASYSDLIQDVDQTQFTVRLRTIVTGDVRADLIKKGRDMLNRTKKDMDKVYQRFSKPLSSMKTLSEDDKRAASEHLRTTVKAQHALVEQAWKAKEQDLLSDQD